MRRNISAGLLTVLFAGTANAAIVYELNGTPVTGPNITVNLAAGSHTLRIYSTTGNEAIPAVTLTGTAASGADLCIIIASGSTPCSGGTAFVGGTTFSGLSFTAGSESLRDVSRLRLSVSSNANGPTTVGRISEFRCLGTIESVASMTATSTDPSGDRAIALIQADGSLLAPIIATQGSIQEIRVPNGVIGPPPGTAGPTISAANIGTIQAGTINANIVASGALNFLNATVGCLHGTVDAGAIEGRDSTALDPCVVVVLTDTPAASGVSAHR
jgi:hypothetical protein